MKKALAFIGFGLSFLIMASCGNSAPTPVDQGYGPHPVLPEPNHALIPTVNVAKAVGWPQGGMPKAPPGFTVTAYAAELEHPRWVYLLPNGDVLVAESNAPEIPNTEDTDKHGVSGLFMKHAQKKAGAAPKSPDKIILLHGLDANGHAKSQSVFLENLHSPFGMALVGDNLYVANTDALLRFIYHNGDSRLTGRGVKVTDLPGGLIDHHWTKNVIAGKDGKHLYVTVGSNSNAGENGLDNEVNRACILEIDPKAGTSRVFASGLRNPNGMGWQPQSGTLWTAVNERDELGDNLVPDYMTSVKDGAFYGWPYSYYGRHVDDRVKPQSPEMVAKAIAPDYALGNHTASLGLAFYEASAFPAHYKNGVFIGQHGSWNRSVKNGYKVAFIAFDNGTPKGMPEDFLTGFLDKDGNAQGRPVGVAVDSQGALLVADDVGNIIWRVAAAGK